MSDGEIVVIPKKELDEKEKLINSLNVKCQKMRSDFRRYKERVDGKEEAIQEKVHGELARLLLSVADTLERAMNSDSKEAGGDDEGYCEIVEKMLEGTRSNLGMTYNQLLNALGVTLSHHYLVRGSMTNCIPRLRPRRTVFFRIRQLSLW